MDAQTSAVDELCPTCKFGVGHPYSVRIHQDTTVSKLRCDACGREWSIVPPPTPVDPSFTIYPH